MIKIGETDAKFYVGDMQPVTIYRAAHRVFGWHSQTVSGEGTISLDGAYNVPPDALVIDGKCQQTVTVQGKNLFDASKIIDGYYVSSTDGTLIALADRQTSNYIPVSASTTYVRTIFGALGEDLNRRVAYYDVNKIYISGTTLLQDGVVQTPQGCAFLRTSWQSDKILASEIQLEQGSVATTYTAFVPDSPSPTYPAPITSITGDLTITAANGDLSDTVVTPLGSVELCSLPDGTRDEYDCVTGVLTKRVGKVIYDGSADEGWTIHSVNDNGLTNFRIPPAYTPADLAIFNQVGAQTAYINDRFPEENVPIASAVNEAMLISNKTLYLRISTSRFTAVAELRTWLAANPVTVYYKLAEPYTIQLTPDLPVVRTGIKSLSVSANITPTFTATVKAMD